MLKLCVKLHLEPYSIVYFNSKEEATNWLNELKIPNYEWEDGPELLTYAWLESIGLASIEELTS